MPINEIKLDKEYKSLRGRMKFRIFTALSMPATWFSGLRMDKIDHETCTTSLPGGWRSQNPFKTMYWAVQGMGAELATGAHHSPYPDPWMKGSGCSSSVQRPNS